MKDMNKTIVKKENLNVQQDYVKIYSINQRVKCENFIKM